MAIPIQYFCTRWGSEHINWDDFCRRVKAEQYDGIEYGIAASTTSEELEELWNAAEKYGLSLIGQHYDTGEPQFSIHLKLYEQWLKKIKKYPWVKVNSQTGRDFFSPEENTRLIETAAASGMNILHETHRGKFSFAAHIAKNYLKNLPELRLTLDISHWVCVSESFLEDFEDAVEWAITRTDHVHARVGYTEGPQVPDPRVSVWQEALDKHLGWWDRVVNLKQKQNLPLSITPEFGPFPYMVPNPTTGKPVSDQWEVNTWMMRLLKKRYGQ
jgi:sugar phosphate isomerase/epimerase